MTLRIYNTLTRTKEVFTPIDPKNVRMYVCGPTVYDYAHIGNARPAIVFDVLFRLLRHTYGADHVTYVRNITDVDDKINARALRDYPDTPLNDAIRKVTEKTYDQYQKDVAALGCLPPTAQPRATEHIQGMVEMIQTLLDQKYAYVAQGEEGREALFDVKTMPEYGKLSGRKQEELKPGARVAVENHKRNPGDFVLWKESKVSEPGWDATFELCLENQNGLKLNSPTVTIFGRPGWHIECSVMSMDTLLKPYGGGYGVSEKSKNTFDIHGGGLDLIFPHHENEIAQSCCALGTKVMANYWMHNGFLQVEGQKMSKSLGNFRTIAEVLEKWPGDVARLNMLRTHYSQPIDWTDASLEASQRMLTYWSGQLFSSHLRFTPQHKTFYDDFLPNDEVLDALNDDLNTHEAFTVLHRIARSGTKRDVEWLYASLNLMGLIDYEFLSGFKFKPEATLEEEVVRRIESLITARLDARKAKNWAESDRIRDELLAMGIQIKDIKDPVTGELKTDWEVKR